MAKLGLLAGTPTLEQQLAAMAKGESEPDSFAQSYLLRPLHGLLAVADFPRRGLATAGFALGGFGAEEAWTAAKSGREVIRLAAPRFARDNPGLTTALGIAEEIMADPLNLFLFASPTKAGLEAGKVTGKLARTWAKQAQAGQRALVQFIWPSFRGGFHLERHVLARAPKALAAMATVGRGLARPFSFLRARTWTPEALEALQLYDRAGIEPHVRLIALNEAAAEIEDQLGPEAFALMQRAAEHVGRSTARHVDELARYTPEIQRAARQYKTLVDTSKDIAEMYLGRQPSIGGPVHQAIKETTQMRAKELDRLADEIGGQWRAIADNRRQADRLRSVASQQASEEWDLRQVIPQMDDAGRALQAKKVADGHARAATRATQEAQKLESALDSDIALALRAGDAAADPFLAKGSVLQNLDNRLERLREIADEVPNFVPRSIGPEGMKGVMRFEKSVKKAGTYVWSDDVAFRMNRGFVNRYDWNTLRKLEPTEKAMRELVAPIDLREVESLMRAPPVGSRIETFGQIAQGGTWDRFNAWIRGSKPEAKLERFYQMGEGIGLRRMNQRIIARIKTKEMIQGMQNLPDVFSRTARESWVQLRDLSSELVDQVGDAWIHPEVFDELNKVYTRMQMPESMNAILRATDRFTRTFKRWVTGQEIKGVPLWPSYHFRNNGSDHMLMTYNGVFSIKGVWEAGGKAVWKGKETLVDAGSAVGKIPADELRRMAQAYGITFGEVTEMGARAGLGQKLENTRRIGYWVDRMRAGFSPFQAALETKKVLFDYSQMSDFERHVLKRVIPFWAWIRNNVQLQARTLLQRPAIIQAQMRVGMKYEGLDDVPDWVRGRGMIFWKKDQQTQEEQYLIGLGLPVEDLAEMLDGTGGYSEWMRQVAFRANPLIKLGVGAAGAAFVGRAPDIERGRLMDEPTSAPYLKWFHKKDSAVWDQLQDKMGARATKRRDGTTRYTVHPYWDWFLRNMPGGGRSLATARLAAKEDRTLGEKVGSFFTGLRRIEHEPARSRKYRQRREAEEALWAARRTGDVGFYSVPYRRRGSAMTAAEFAALRARTGRR
jgi:hypothetical protein